MLTRGSIRGPSDCEPSALPLDQSAKYCIIYEHSGKLSDSICLLLVILAPFRFRYICRIYFDRHQTFFTSEQHTFCSLSKVRRHVIGCVNHDIVFGLCSETLLRLSCYINLVYGDSKNTEVIYTKPTILFFDKYWISSSMPHMSTHFEDETA